MAIQIAGDAPADLPTLEFRVGQTSERIAQACDDPTVATVLVTSVGRNYVRAVGPGNTRCGSKDSYTRTDGEVVEIRTAFDVIVVDAPRTIVGKFPSNQADRLQPLIEHGVGAPRVWHDSSVLRDGSDVCAITHTDFVQLYRIHEMGRIFGEDFVRIPLRQIVRVSEDWGVVVVTGANGHRAVCTVGRDETGAEPFLRATRRAASSW